MILESGNLLFCVRAPGKPETAGCGTGRRDPESHARLLLLEDDGALRQMLTWELSELGYLVYPVGTCLEARTALAERTFDFALFDVGLPDGSGAELAVELAELGPIPGIVLCSGRPGLLDLETVPRDVIACLTKPVSVRHLDRLFRGAA